MRNFMFLNCISVCDGRNDCIVVVVVVRDSTQQDCFTIARQTVAFTVHSTAHTAQSLSQSNRLMLGCRGNHKMATTLFQSFALIRLLFVVCALCLAFCCALFSQSTDSNIDDYELRVLSARRIVDSLSKDSPPTAVGFRRRSVRVWLLECEHLSDDIADVCY